MKREGIKKLVGSHVQLIPSAHSMGANGRPLPLIDDDWLVESSKSNSVRIVNVRNLNAIELGFGEIHNFAENFERSTDGQRYGFLILLSQISMKGVETKSSPTFRPGETVPVVLPSKKSGLLGDGHATSIAVKHDLGTQAVTTCLYLATSPYAEVDADVEHTSEDIVTFSFASAPSIGQFAWVIQAL